MLISMIAAMGSNRVIGKDNDIPWHLPDDFKFFKDTTKSHYVIMGRKNWESLPAKLQPLPNRTNIVITRQADYKAPGAIIVPTLNAAMKIAKEAKEEEAFVIGGGEIYRMALETSNRIYLTEINEDFDGQVTFPEFDKTEWKETSRVHHGTDDQHEFEFDFVTYEKNLH
ncbi:MAG: dihydrofolate reductase [Cytophagales bacterium]|nr:dihydrofolate reductase [Cytophagales bacterium]